MIDLSVIGRAAQITDSAILMFSGGKDSIASLDLAAGHFKRLVPVFLYFVKGLSFREAHIKHYSRRYGLDFYQFPMVDSLAKHAASGAYQLHGSKKIPKVRFGDIELFLRRTFNIEWMIYGYKRADSLERRGIIRLTDHGISHKYHKIYSLAEWTGREVFRYIKMKKLPLPPDYAQGFRDVSNFKGEALLWLYHNYPDDYELVKKQYPLIEAALMRAQEGTTWGKRKKML